MNPAMGGPCQGIRNSIPALEAIGCRNEVVCLDDPQETFGMVDPFVIHRLEPSRGAWATSDKLIPWLLANLSNYDVVIIHGLWLYHSYAVTRAIKKLKRSGGNAVPKVYVMPHGMLDPWFQRHPSRRLKAWRNWVVWKAIEQRVIAQADGVLFTCQRELELARETFRPYRPQREINVGYGVPEPPAITPTMQQAFRAACPQLEGRDYLLFLSRIHPKKGVDLLLQAYAQVRRDCPVGKRLPALVIAGPVDTAYAREMKQLARNSNFAADVFFPGMLQGDAKWGAFYGCQAFVLPSHQENFGIAVVEAMACGKAVLISDQVNICSEVHQSEAGLVDSDSCEGAARMLQRFAHLNEDQKAALGKNARHCYEQHFAIEQAAVRFFEVVFAEHEFEIGSAIAEM